MTTPLLLSIDQGTTSSRAMLFEKNSSTFAVAQREFTQFYPQSGWVEHDPEEIWKTTLTVCQEALATARAANRKVATIGITNQRETTLIWDRHTGKPIYNAIVWQDRRTAERCRDLQQQGHSDKVASKTGLLLDPYFSGTKIAWILDNVEGARARADKGELAFGTIDSFLMWRLTNGRVHATDATNAGRTLLFNIHTNSWDDELCALLDVPRSLLPEVHDSAANFCTTDKSVLGEELPVAGVAGDQHAASIGQVCFQPGMVKSTYGTGCFMMLNTGTEAIPSTHRLLTTIAYRLDGVTTYAIEGSIFVAGAAVQWLRDGLGIIQSAEETQSMAMSLEDNQGVYLVPAFTGLGAPHWDAEARGALFGLTRDSGPAVVTRAALEAVCYQTMDLLNAMRKDGASINTVRVDGGMVKNDWLTQYLANVLDIAIERPRQTETTALGAAYLAGLQTGMYGSLDELTANWQQEHEFTPTMDDELRKRVTAGWADAVRRTRSNY
ncbi:glycerol kinase GlpK [Granulosicoccus antarcticus]|uniref:Glycerol kinase n=1 Tax=Granulosicoccus antarcticus IMCC3135 TaxID=1192854 RepID=A0A2Z2NL99_9GAMM|nr:glycerol kinase GlpK [Granulosicoccus antarcticus]ASJ70568.1 Glycerol kinase [Granulosicoccus antarcticus IMCC3135]